MGLHEFHDMCFFLHFLRKDDFFVDVGANVGAYTILAGAAIGADGIAFEPIPSTYGCLEENIRLNNVQDSVLPLNKGVGERADTLRFTSKSGPMNHALRHGESVDDSIMVDVVTLDSALIGKKPTMLKIDVEGLEMAVLQGGLETLKKDSLKAMIIEMNGRNAGYHFDETDMFALLSKQGFKPHAYDPFGRTITSVSESQALSYGNNVIFLRDKPFAQKRCNKANRVDIHNASL